MRTAGGEEISRQHGALQRSQQTSDNAEDPSRTTTVEIVTEMILCVRGIALELLLHLAPHLQHLIPSSLQTMNRVDE